MNSSILLALLVITLCLTLAWLVSRFGKMRQTYYQGITVWSRWLPVCATGVYLAVLTVNLASGGAPGPADLSLSGAFSVAELIILLLIGPLFLTRQGTMIAAGAALYCMERLLFGQQAGTTVALTLMVAAITVIALIGDQMPWLAADRPNRRAQRLRSLLLVVMTLGALFVVFVALVKAHAFTRWLGTTCGVRLPSGLVLGLLVALFIGWLSVGLGMVRHLTIPVLSLPTLIVLAFLSDWPSHLLAIPFAGCMALSLVVAERRSLTNRRSGGIAATVVLSR